MVRPKPPHLHAKFLSRNRLTLSEPMAARLDAFHARIPKVSKATLARIARKDSRILEITPDTFASNVARTSDLLNATTAAFFKLAFRQPALIYLDPWSLRLKLRRLAKHFGIRPKDLIPVIWRNPTILTRADETLIAAITALAEYLQLAPPLAAKLLLKHPTLFNLKVARIDANLRVTAHLLNVPFAACARAALIQPQLCFQSPHTILRNVTDSARHLGITTDSFVAVAMGMPSLLFRSPDGMARKRRLLMRLLYYTREERTFEQFLHAGKAALTYSPERILARCLIARYRLSGLRAHTLLVMSNKTATALLREHLKLQHGTEAYRIYRRWKQLRLLTTE